jgi:hypothetical protein
MRSLLTVKSVAVGFIEISPCMAPPQFGGFKKIPKWVRFQTGFCSIYLCIAQSPLFISLLALDHQVKSDHLCQLHA